MSCAWWIPSRPRSPGPGTGSPRRARALPPLPVLARDGFNPPLPPPKPTQSSDRDTRQTDALARAHADARRRSGRVRRCPGRGRDWRGGPRSPAVARAQGHVGQEDGRRQWRRHGGRRAGFEQECGAWTPPCQQLARAPWPDHNIRPAGRPRGGKPAGRPEAAPRLRP